MSESKMPETKKVKDLMVPVSFSSDYPIVYNTDTLKDAIKVLKKCTGETKIHRSMIVLKKEGTEEKLAGILTVRDILNAIKVKTINDDKDGKFPEKWGNFYRKSALGHSVSTKVSDAIRPLVTEFVNSEQDVADAIRIMMTKKINILPVFDGGKPIGIIRAVDILYYIEECL
ncbi:putative signal-transduction protein containing cAMP-binding and CBS domains [Desulfosporosinus orientis DSM 765]|uniref:Putative signal-transduction protein containing cAMP-binding and CBS domains n=1 Tax=Desulfosporosinus orientis (strain ATCC 19365 / DSM 765 / NCIMB 8382 / VKM B-1628 / Singapore I) TaxID=768706 RepID=G7W6H7_DESOD|nr:CBS domain-containing protein [Desulfosporosinus orientis]AET68615.1 putative signal-transduction protein containing cAMP-binding and CBS domains [Desulfosporosinus orientis DSM 765]